MIKKKRGYTKQAVDRNVDADLDYLHTVILERFPEEYGLYLTWLLTQTYHEELGHILDTYLQPFPHTKQEIN